MRKIYETNAGGITIVDDAYRAAWHYHHVPREGALIRDLLDEMVIHFWDADDAAPLANHQYHAADAWLIAELDESGRIVIYTKNLGESGKKYLGVSA